MKDTLTKMKNNLQGINSRVDKAENQIVIWNIRKQKTPHQNSKKKKIIQRNDDSVRSLWDNFKHTNIHIMGLPEGEEKEQEIENLFEKITTENFPNLVKEIGT